ncbi:hypothetical protein CNMCM5623_000814 [Aspergillus felis]|uniref:Uncharacterized protein n=1 Tax=Aspergillus felis TaxID=1287682 RepID=A0A8H6Q7H0_9EURO|nr:hypothetical protein CNMCM5623_000814 [Aspergillus felis]
MTSLSHLKQLIALRPEYFASSPTTIWVKQHSNSWSAGDFIISTVSNDGSPPQTLFTVDGAAWPPSAQRRRIQEATGLPLFEIARKQLGWHMLKDTFDVHFCGAAGGDGGGEEIVRNVRGHNMWKSRAHVYDGDVLVMTSKLKHMVSVYIPGKRPEWEIEVAEGMDLSLASIIGVLRAAMLHQSTVAVGITEKASLM